MRNKGRPLLLSIFLLLISPSSFSDGVGSGLYTVNLAAVFMGGSSGSVSANYSSPQTVMGECLAVPPDVSSATINASVGILKLYGFGKGEKVYIIKDLKAKAHSLGENIPEGIWQNDSSPYFYWKNSANPPESIVGYSYSLDNPPEDKINLNNTYYQYPDEEISEGKHTFFVKPFSGFDWGLGLSFNIWVDTQAPVFKSVLPAGGSVISSPDVEIQASIEDAYSGVDFSRTVMSVNGQAVSADYSAQDKTLTYQSKGLQEGEVTVSIEALDLAGNKSNKSWVFIFDSSSPTGSIIINSQDKIANSPYVILTLEANDAVSGTSKMYLSNDGVFDKELSSPYDYSRQFNNWLLAEPDKDGEKTVYAMFEDKAGNLSEVYSAAISLKLLTPDTRIISGPERVTDSAGAEFAFEATSANCLFSYMLDNGEWSQWSTAKDAKFSGLAEGNHYFFVKSAFDLNADGTVAVNEEDATAAEWVWTIGQGQGIEKPKENLFWKLSRGWYSEERFV